MGMETSPNFTPKVQQIIAQSKNFAQSLNASEVTTDHLLLVILELEDPFVSSFVNSFSFSVEQVKNFTISFCALSKEKDAPEYCTYSDDFNELLVSATHFSRQIDNSYVCLEHVFFALLNIKDGPLYSFFYAYDVSPHKVIQAYVVSIKSQEESLTERNFNSRLPSLFNSPPDAQSQPESILDTFCVSFNALFNEGKIGKIIGKEAEINRVCEILCRKNKNNPLLLGEPGVGKTAIIEGLASSIVEGKVPPFLSDKQIYAVDLSSMIAGTKYRGQFEQRIKTLISECKKDPNIILFIDEIHTMVGAGSAEGALDAANILKPELARGEIKLIGATTFSEFKKNIEKDHALTRRFECVQVSEPSTTETYQILKGIKKSYESFHGVKYNLKLLKQIIDLCDLYFPNKRFPDKAIDVMDDIGTKVKIRNLTPPAELIEVESQLYNIIETSRPDTIKEEEDLIAKHESLMNSWRAKPMDNVSIDDVLTVISQKAKIPKENLVHEKDKNTMNLKRKLSRDIINQDSAVSCMSRSILRSKIGLKDNHKPIGSFLFLGSSGVGKTWSAKMIAKHYFGSEKNLFRFDMSEYSEKVSASKLIGASPGYVGYEEGGVLVEYMKKNPHCVLLFDEIEKADPTVQQLLLQILEEGEIEDNVGTTVYFKDCIIILTSNIGSDLTSKSTLGFAPNSEDNNSKIKDLARKSLSPELVNRLDEVIVFNHLSKDNLIKIFAKEISSLKRKLKSKKISIDFDPSAIDSICERASSEKMGARPLKRLIHSEIEDKIVDFYYKNSSDIEQNFLFSLKDDEIVFDLV
tara:strand:+ start:8516 stop:10930 length:2415 start_codon:yes stop_codon:yes gene_type:complete